MRVGKESIRKFLIGNQLHVKLRLFSPYSNTIKKGIQYLYLNKTFPKRGIQ